MKEKTPASQKGITAFCILVLALTLLLGVLPANADYEVYEKTVRLHVLAHSDSEEDQALKLAVRDALLTEVEALTEHCDSASAAADAITDEIPALRALAVSTLRERGCDLPVEITVTEEYYPTRSYEDVTLPAGNYRSVRVLIGEAQGKNWWCVLFPPLCVGSASAPAAMERTGFSPDQIRILAGDEAPRYVLRFRILEWFGQLGALFSA